MTSRRLHMTSWVGRVGGGAAAALAISLATLAAATPSAVASHQQVSIIQEDRLLSSDPAATLQELRHLGVDMVRVSVHWSSFAPDPTSHRVPQFNATDPNAYPASDWAPLDTVVLDAAADGIQVMLVPTAWAPFWAEGPNPRRYGAHYDLKFAWEPNPREFGQFVQAVGARYSGSFVPPGSSTPLPHVSFWELYNEPNFGMSLAPQAINGSRLPTAPRMYRALADSAWAALQATGHGQDTALIGALGADGGAAPPSRYAPQGLPGTYAEMKPLTFIRELYCLTPTYHRYFGSAAYQRGCPTTASGYAHFRAQHPVLFAASGVSDHPYVIRGGFSPVRVLKPDPNKAEFAQIPQLARALSRIQRVYGGRAMPVWNTEYGYITCPPTCSEREVSPSTAATYINWAEYISWRNPRMASTMQYLLFDGNPRGIGVPEYGGFASGLVFYSGMPKPSYYAYRMPIFLPYTRTRRGGALEVWGDVRPAPVAVADGDGIQYVQIQFARRGSNSWTTLATLPVTDPHGYFDTWLKFPAGGSVRTVWTYPPSDTTLKSMFVTNSNGTVTSRTVQVAVGGAGSRRARSGNRHTGRRRHR